MYAMILKNTVIGIVESDVVPFWPPDARGNAVMPVECDNTVEIGMIYNAETNTFSENIPVVKFEQLSDAELIQAELLLSQQEIITKQEAIDETLAALLLSQQV